MRLKGSLTIFLSLVLLIITAVTGSLLEAARVKVSKEIVLDNSYLSVQNVLSEFQREIFNDYKVFFIDVAEAGGEEEVLKTANGYLVRMTGKREGEADFMGINAGIKDISFKENMTENNCFYFARQAAAYMKYGVFSAAGEKIIKNAELINNAEKGADALKKIVRAKTDAEKKLLSIHKARKKAEEKAEKINKGLKELRNISDDIESGSLDLEKARKNISSALKNMNADRREAESALQEYSREKKEASGLLEEYDRVFEEESKKLDEEAAASLNKSKAEVTEFNEENFRAKVDESIASVNEVGAVIEKEDMKADELRTALSKIKTADKTESEEIPQLDGKVNAYIRNTESITHEGAASGGLAWFMPKGKKVSKLKVKPAVWGEVRTTDGGSLSLIDRGLLVLYAKRHFYNFLSEPKKNAEKEALRYGIEYLVMGADSDEENLSAVVYRIFGIRTLSSFAYLLTRQDKVAEARSIAVSVAGALGIPAAVSIIETGILMGWAADMARGEVKLLLEGKEIALFPGNEAIKAGYLNFLDAFLAAEYSKLPERMVRLIEHNIRLRYKKSFRADGLYAGVDCTVNYVVEPRIFRLWFLDSFLQKDFNGWETELFISRSLSRTGG